VEEVKKLQDALARLLRRARSKSSARGSSGAGEDRPPLDRFLNCPSCLEVDRRVVRTTKHGEEDGGRHSGDLSPDTKIILTRARDLLDNSSGIRQKSFKFLLKKMFVCNGGFPAPARSLKDPVESRMEKVGVCICMSADICSERSMQIRLVLCKRALNFGLCHWQFFRTMLGKKMNAGSGNGTASSGKKYLLEDGTKGKRRGGGGRRCGCEEEEREESCRWDRTDSECKSPLLATVFIIHQLNAMYYSSDSENIFPCCSKK
jgi:hypothetical protein